MVTEYPRATAAPAGELLTHVGTLRADADFMGGYARQLLATAATLSGCPVAPEGSPPALERQAAACTTAAEQLRTAAEALDTHTRRPGLSPRKGSGPSRGRTQRTRSAAARGRRRRGAEASRARPEPLPVLSVSGRTKRLTVASSAKPLRRISSAEAVLHRSTSVTTHTAPAAAGRAQHSFTSRDATPRP
ncbi:hypothetical protein M878_03670 [Streptomyces roseochromogenus subsp. oscitans DS 12.976]|uniref:Uncharacterized protein n=1 Tax=Streptomyces roseochromogenus subsp. oscitans DS 12.976 TaxID=1352936 RepID=V6L452_STRRC|nr:hypothetical protein M878_03670 [Streptomyces roseochromogenus subsp. oscitans DS 12.976]